MTWVSVQNNQNGSNPSEICGLSKLTFLGIFNNSLTGTIPTEIGQCTELTKLAISSNSFTGFIPSEIGLLTKLESLFNNGNYLLNWTMTETLCDQGINLYVCNMNCSCCSSYGCN